MPTIRQSLVANLTRMYPLYSGCGTFANKPFVQKIAGTSNDCAWAQVSGGEILAPLDDYVGRAAFYTGDLDRKITWICDRILRPGDTALDIGANIGIVTVWLSKLVGKNGRVHSFEPNPQLLEILQQTLNRNQISNVSLHPIALGAKTDFLDLKIPQVNAGSASLVRYRDSPDCKTIKVPVGTLSDIIAAEKIESIRLIKIDVEGFEAEVLKGGREILEKIRPEAILFELNDKLASGSVRDRPLIKILTDLEYGFFSIPKCLFKMNLKYFDPNISYISNEHDFLAVPKGKCYEEIAKLTNAVLE